MCCRVLERCPSGLRSAPGKCVYLKRVSRVRIPLSPPGARYRGHKEDEGPQRGRGAVQRRRAAQRERAANGKEFKESRESRESRE